MSPVQLVAIGASLLASVAVLVLLARRSFRERHAAWWILASAAALALSAFPGIVDWAARLLGVADPVNLVLFGAVVLLFLASAQLSAEATTEEARTRRLAEESALQDARIRELERSVAELRARLRREALDPPADRPDPPAGDGPDAGPRTPGAA